MGVATVKTKQIFQLAHESHLSLQFFIKIKTYQALVNHDKYAVSLLICNPRGKVRGRIYMSIIKHSVQFIRVEHTKDVTYSQSEQQGLIRGTFSDDEYINC